MTEYDIVIVGGGHNGLTVAAYFSMLGYHTVVVEKNPHVGGGVVTSEVMPGVRQDLNSMVHGLVQANPMIREDELGLQSDFGLNYVRQDAIFGLSWLDGSQLMLHMDVNHTAKSIERFSEKDAQEYRKLLNWAQPTMELALDTAFSPPPATSAMLALLESNRDGQELLQLSFLNIVDTVSEWFDDPHLQAAFVKLATDFAHLDPKMPGTAVLPLLELTLVHKYGYAIPRGGSGVLSESLAKCIRAYGGDIFVNSTVTEIVVNNGAATAVKTKDGRLINARKAIVADLNIKQIPQLCGEDKFDSSFLAQVRRIVHSQAGSQLEWVVSDYPKFLANPDLMKCFGVRFAESVEDILSVHEGIERGVPQWKESFVFVPTLLDHSRAPAGIHTLNMYMENPYCLRDGGPGAWDMIKDDLAQKSYDNLRAYAPNMTNEKVLRRYFHSPLDIERTNPAMIRGDIYHIAPIFSQTGSYRPLPGYGDFKTPVERLYLCGPSTGAGGGVSGQARAAVIAIVGYLGQNFDQLLSNAHSKRKVSEESSNT